VCPAAWIFVSKRTSLGHLQQTNGETVMAKMERVRTAVLDIAYEQAGPPDGYPVVLLHGFPYDPRAFDDVNPAQNSEGHAKHFIGGCERRVFDLVGRNPPQESPQALAQAIIDAAK
jgi:pimeloyl-ACP methyl ester carboxylesterase